MLRLNMSIPPTARARTASVRRLGDNAAGPTVAGSATTSSTSPLNGLEGALFTPQYWPAVLGDGVNGNDERLPASFPYVALPARRLRQQPRSDATPSRREPSSRAGPALAARAPLELEGDRGR